jgi:hypothetical protein
LRSIVLGYVYRTSLLHEAAAVCLRLFLGFRRECSAVRWSSARANGFRLHKHSGNPSKPCIGCLCVRPIENPRLACARRGVALG